MKKLILASVAFAALGMMAVGCTSKEKEVTLKPVESNICHKLVLSEDVAKLYEDMEDIYFQSDLNLVIPETVGGQPSEVLTKALLKATFPEDSVSKTWDEAIKSFNELPGDLDGCTLGEKVDSIPQVAFFWSQTVRLDSMVRHNNLLTFRTEQEGFLGGAHGYYTAGYLNYDADADKVLVAEDLFADMNSARSLILKALVRKNGLKEEKDLETNGVVFAVEGVKVPANFYLEKDSVVFYYNPYEISSWAQGEIEVKVPNAEMDSVMTEYGKKLLVKE